MRLIVRFLFYWVFLVGTMEAEVMGFPIMLEQIVPGGLGNSDCKKLEKPPEASPFFIEGEELWDVKRAFANAGGEESLPEWIVWQPRRKIVVAKGAPSTLFHIHRRMDDWEGRFSVNAMLKLEVFEAPADRSPWIGGSKLLAQLSWTNRSGTKTSATSKVRENALEAESEITAGGISPVLEGQIAVQYKGKGEPVFSMVSGIRLGSGEPSWIARFDLEGKGYDLVLSGALERLDGGPLRNHVLVADGNEIRSIPRSLRPDTLGVAGDGMVRSIPFPSSGLERLCVPASGKDHGESDPFVSPGNDEETRVSFTDTPVPEELTRMLGDAALDLRPFEKGSGMVVPDGDFITYDLRGGALVHYTRSKERVSLMDGWFIFDCRVPAKLVAISSGDGRLRLVGPGNQKARMDVKRDGESLFAMEMEPVIGEGERFIESLLDFADKISDLTYRSTMTFSRGRDTEVVRGDQGTLTLRADVIPVEE